jgi:eukaryotic-like serine/threonine-protein kinase
VALSPGTLLGRYEIVSAIGAGGMGEVYRARDTRLNRDVAIKAILPEVASDTERVARFEREAQLLASLNHPNIGAIHGIQEADGATYLVLEFVDGRPLSDLLRQGALPVEEALPLARGIADALAAAHERGVIHRDLKPGNVMVTADGQAKVLDFGLGKSIDSGHSAASDTPAANSPTMMLAGTQAGIILGTAGYMSPEQARGRAADKRSDVWAFGCVLFEMLAGTRAFAGDDITDTLAAIVRGEPEWSALPAGTPPALRALIERCLVKDRAQRLPDMSVVRFILNEPSSIGGVTSPAPASGTSGRRAMSLPAALGLVAAAVIVTAGLAVLWPSHAPAGARGVSRFTIALPDGDAMSDPTLAPLAVASDGSAVAYAAVRAGKSQLFVRDFADPEPRALPGTDGAESPFFKPDGRWIGFFAQGRLKKITVAGTALQELADAPFSRGGTWSVDDTIYFAPENISGLWKVPASGGRAVAVTKLDQGAGEVSHRWPTVLPDGRSLLFCAWTGPGPDEHRIERLTLDDGTRQVLVRNVEGPASVVGGFLIDGGRVDSPQALPWPPSRGDLTGIEPIELPFASQAEGEGASAYAVSTGGTFAYLQAVRQTGHVVWIDRTGRIDPLPLPERPYVAAAISPDGRRAALHISSGTKEIWLYDFASQTLTPLVTTGGSSQAPLWSADGKYVFYRGTRSGHRNLFRKAADGVGAEEPVTTKAGVVQTPQSVTSDGKWLIYQETGQGTSGAADIWRLPLDGQGTPNRIIATSAYERFARVSPDSRWIAYASDVSGRDEVWVQPFEGTGARRQISRNGGVAPLWSRDGRELFFTAPDAIMTVPASGETFGTPRELFAGRFVPSENSNTNYDIARDGRFLLIVPTHPAKPITRIEVILNGLELLRRPGSANR